MEIMWEVLVGKKKNYLFGNVAVAVWHVFGLVLCASGLRSLHPIGQVWLGMPMGIYKMSFLHKITIEDIFNTLSMYFAFLPSIISEIKKTFIQVWKW